jgi:hypothetical protein
MITLFTNESFQFELEITLGTTYRQGRPRRGGAFDWLDGVLGAPSA